MYDDDGGTACVLQRAALSPSLFFEGARARCGVYIDIYNLRMCEYIYIYIYLIRAAARIKLKLDVAVAAVVAVCFSRRQG